MRPSLSPGWPVLERMRPKTIENRRLRCGAAPWGAIVAACVLALSAGAQTRITLEQAGSREGPDFNPTYAGKQVSVSGQVSTSPLLVSESYYLPIQDESAHGLLLQG